MAPPDEVADAFEDAVHTPPIPRCDEGHAEAAAPPAPWGAHPGTGVQPAGVLLACAAADADTNAMESRTGVIAQLVRSGHYVVEESLVADSILLRARMRAMVPEVAFRREDHRPRRSFRRDSHARSFRLSGEPARR